MISLRQIERVIDFEKMRRTLRVQRVQFSIHLDRMVFLSPKLFESASKSYFGAKEIFWTYSSLYLLKVGRSTFDR